MTNKTELNERGTMSSSMIDWFQRLENSRNGNPRYKVKFDNGTIMKTAPDAGWVYAIVPDQLVDRPIAASYHMNRSGNAVLDGLRLIPRAVVGA